MALTERNRNQMAQRRADDNNKRVIDLVSDDSEDDKPLRKTQKHSTQRNDSNHQSARSSTSAYQTPPASSAPRSSQPSFNRGNYESVYTASQPLANTQHSEAERNAWLAEEDDDVDEIFGSTQAADARTEQLFHYGDLPTKIVGVRFYDGYASSGEQVLLRREPGNPYDGNAIRCDNVAGTQIGHIPRRIAAKLAPFMDNSYLHVEGELAGEIGAFEVPLAARLYGPDPATEEGVLLQAEMKQAKLPLNALVAAQRAEKQRVKERKEAERRQLQEARRAAAAAATGSGSRLPTSSQYGYANQSQAGPSAQPVMADILEASERFTSKEMGRATDEYGVKEEALKNMPSAKKPESIKTNMLPYQLQALQWLLDQESPTLPPAGTKTAVQLWKRNDRHGNMFTNIATNFTTQQPPQLARGGIFADDMGLGKTLEMISLIVADNERAGGKTGTTLIVAPLSVMSNWSGQILQHMHKDKSLNVYTYHGAGRVQMKAEDFAQYDVVITTYQTLASDYSPKGKGAKAPEKKLRSSGLYSVEWRRVILDEGHTIRNPQAKGAAAVCAVMGRSKWSLTGTPIVNTLKDLYSQLRFVGITGGLENLEIFNRVLVRPLKKGEPGATYLLQAIMGSFTLRRRKDMDFIDLKLPKLDEYVHRIDFSKKERERYDALNLEAQGLLTTYEKKSGKTGKGAGEAFQHLLEILLRMRQVCNHWQLCSERVTNLLAQLEKQKTVTLTPENKKALQDILQVQIESQEDCPICLETLHNHDPIITTCGHFFGGECITKVIETQSKCPMCRAELKDETCLVAAANECGDEASDDQMDLSQSSSKLESMMEILAASKDSKTVIFSQWTRFLDVVQARLDREGYKYCRLDGTMSSAKRDAALRSLEQDADCTIMLASLGVCAVGLNLTSASQVILSDTWWAPAIEDQAVDRVHRLGQTRPTRVFRLIMDKSIEEATIQVQQDKRKLMRLAFSEKAGKRDQVKAGRLDDIRRLLRSGNENVAGAGVRQA